MTGSKTHSKIGWSVWRVKRRATPDGPCTTFVSVCNGVADLALCEAICRESGPGRYRAGSSDGRVQVTITIS